MDRCDWSMAHERTKVEWRYASPTTGGQFVMINGIAEMQQSSADSLDSPTVKRKMKAYQCLGC